MIHMHQGMCKQVTIVTGSKFLKKEAASSRPGGITWMRPFFRLIRIFFSRANAAQITKV